MEGKFCLFKRFESTDIHLIITWRFHMVVQKSPKQKQIVGKSEKQMA